MGLFKPAWQSKNMKRALKAIKKEENQEKLEDIARQSKAWIVCVSATKKLTDYTVLMDFAKNGKQYCMREAARDTLSKLPDKSFHTDLLNNQLVIADIAKNDYDYQTRESAIEKLTDRNLAQQLKKESERKIQEEKFAAIPNSAPLMDVLSAMFGESAPHNKD